MAFTSFPSPGGNTALTPLPAGERLFGWRDHAALWLSLGVGLLVMQIGAYLVPALGTQAALMVIVFGSVLGAGLLAWTAKIGCDSGLSSAGLMHATYGSSFARLPVLLNIVQLIGWTTFELVVMRDGTVAIARQSGGFSASLWPVLATILWGAVLLALLSGSMVKLVRKFIGRYGLPLIFASLVWLSWQFLSKASAQGLSEIWNRTGNGSMSSLSALDLVIAMPVSWLPLVADFARHGRNGNSALRGTWLGYAVANMWCYSLGLLVALTTPSTDLVAALLLAQGGLIALGLILIDEVDNAYGDVYSGSVAGHSLQPRWSVRRWGMSLAIVCTALALVLPIHSLEPFLLMLSSVFVPLYGVILARLAGQPNVVQLMTQRKVDTSAVVIWLLGVACYHLFAQFSPQWGSALPTLVLTFVLAWLTRSLLNRPEVSVAA
ncbi:MULTISPECIES: cytosine permease [unclassified Polaromonas]|uniref:purine-cytosine permease family protein n=1 Tax=unclassified Polaromonas TaxID=2638319 RepID=UPI0018C9C6B4|nr:MULTISPECIES: cytosine permease [unclassified Polaromonas]MBG6072175.1 putative hydroxymethylpyrimidine transporter CytX [Polaromonas sp. CG_9.7]MBG6114179.1 putative hydroxymethylpyrimidine transporter CytX [Polaromonas sp. CG_9.2]MDH6184731.1 putative hydroxymethylpyrimidine transporter CytX [Polaromonas sp. CG_23.6]